MELYTWCYAFDNDSNPSASSGQALRETTPNSSTRACGVIRCLSLPIPASLSGLLAVLSLVAQRNRKAKWPQLLLVLLVSLTVGGMLASCDTLSLDLTPTPPSSERDPTHNWTPGYQTPSPVRRTPSPTHTPPLSLPYPLPSSGSATTPTSTPIPDPILQVPYHSQLNEPDGGPNACGPAALLMVLDYLGREKSLQKAVEVSKSIPPKDGGYDPACKANPVCTSAGALEEIASQTYGLTVEAHDGWNLEDIHGFLANRHPVIADVTVNLEPGRPGHFVVIYGINLNRQEIYYHDPYAGPNKTAKWTSRFARSWRGPVDIGDPLQPGGHHYWGMAAY